MTIEMVYNAVGIFGIISAIVGGIWALFLFQQRVTLQKAQNYRDLEFKAIDLFLEASRRTDVNLNRIYLPKAELPKGEPNPAGLGDWAPEDRPLFDYTFSILNLFEVMYNMQKRGLVTEEIFLTWVAWYWDFSRGSIPKWLWEDGRWNYSTDFITMMSKFMGMRDDQKKEAYLCLCDRNMIRCPLDKFFLEHAL